MLRGINIGVMDRRITFQYKPEIETEFNSTKKGEWKNIPNSPVTWASIENRPGNEVVSANRVSFDQVTIARIRYRTDLKTEMSFLLDGVRYMITSIIETKGTRRTALDIQAFRSE